MMPKEQQTLGPPYQLDRQLPKKIVLSGFNDMLIIKEQIRGGKFERMRAASPSVEII